MNDKKEIEAKSFNIGFVAVCGFGIGIFFGTTPVLLLSYSIFYPPFLFSTRYPF